MRKLATLFACLWIVAGPSRADAVPINQGETFRIDFSLTRIFPGPFDEVFFSPVFGPDILDPGDSLTFAFYDSADRLLVQRTFDIDGGPLPVFGTGAVFDQTTLDSAGYVLLTPGAGSVNIIELTLNFASQQGDGLTAPITLTFPIPEPTSLALSCAALAGLILRRKRAKLTPSATNCGRRTASA